MLYPFLLIYIRKKYSSWSFYIVIISISWTWYTNEFIGELCVWELERLGNVHLFYFYLFQCLATITQYLQGHWYHHWKWKWKFLVNYLVNKGCGFWETRVVSWVAKTCLVFWRSRFFLFCKALTLPISLHRRKRSRK